MFGEFFDVAQQHVDAGRASPTHLARFHGGDDPFCFINALEKSFIHHSDVPNAARKIEIENAFDFAVGGERQPSVVAWPRTEIAGSTAPADREEISSGDLFQIEVVL